MTSEDVKNSNDLALGMLDASYKEEIKEFEKTSASANLSVWSWFFGGGGASASYEKTRETMKSKGLTDAQITTLINAFLDRAKKCQVWKLTFTSIIRQMIIPFPVTFTCIQFPEEFKLKKKLHSIEY